MRPPPTLSWAIALDITRRRSRLRPRRRRQRRGGAEQRQRRGGAGTSRSAGRGGGGVASSRGERGPAPQPWWRLPRPLLSPLAHARRGPAGLAAERVGSGTCAVTGALPYPSLGAHGSGEYRGGEVENPVAAADGWARGAEPALVGDAAAALCPRRAAHPRPLSKRGAGPGAWAGWGRVGAGGERGISSRAEPAGGWEVGGRGPQAGKRGGGGG